MPVSRYAQVLSQQLGKRGDQRRADEGGASGLPRKLAAQVGPWLIRDCYEDTPVLRNTLDIRDEKTLYLIEAEQSRANMMLLYEQGFHDFTPEGLRNIHRFLFGDIYQWAGEYRIINIAKREKRLRAAACGTATMTPLRMIWFRPFRIFSVRIGRRCSREAFVSAVVRCFAKIWQIHPFREGNTGRW